ncbi:MAG: universal stress protein [Jatrophihabitans endophyticus]|nr:universal stress protein [Jatrophihabitans endophyticus]
MGHNADMGAHGFELGTDGPERILVGVDGSETSMHAGAWALGTARREGAQLIVLYVASTSAMSAQMSTTAGAVLETYDEIATGLRTQMLEVAAARGVDAVFVQRAGNPYHELVAVANERRVDAVVIGASMQAGHRLVGSLAGRLVRDASWPVTVVP